MPKIHNLAEKCRTKMVFPSSNLEACKCEESNLPPWTGEMHGLSQALLSRSPKMRLFWWTVMAICICCGTTTTTMVIVEYLNGPTATSTTIRLVNSLELPSITICPKVPDALNDIGLLADIKHAIPGLSNDECLDLVRFWIGGYGLENMDLLPTFNRSYLKKLNQYFHTWSSGYSTDDFFDTTQDKYGYNCNDLFYSCELGGVVYDCCNDLFVKKLIMRRGICYTTRAGVNQSESDDMGRLVLSLKALPSITTTRSNYIQDQIIVYVTDNHEKINDFPRFYLYPNEWNRMRFTARFLELLEQAGVCTDSIFGKDSECIIRRWLKTNIVDPYNCTLSYLNITGISISNPCDPFVLASNYYSAIQLVWSSSSTRETCTPGCKRWEYQITMQQSKTLHSFEGYLFNLEVSFNDLQYEHVKEVYTISIPGLISQIGGQFGFFLGLSIITFLQMILYGIHYTVKTFYNKTHRYLKSISENRSGIGWLSRMSY
uniref:Amiloride-sensitive sodium channel n=1 Tax=Syphacia muris TaxID=451379 RepID=A0A158R418_9BILA